MSKVKLKEIIDVDFNSLDSFHKIMNRRAGTFIDDGLSAFHEFIKFSTGKNDLQEWIERNRMLDGKPFRYDDAGVEMRLGKRDKQLLTAPRPYLTQYINDQCKDKSIIKCRQSEFTVNEINENIWLASTIPYCNVRHIFPTGGMALEIAKEKISPSMENSPSINRLLKKPLSYQSKEFINGSFYTVSSSWTDHGGRGPSSDKITFDEYESQNPQIEEIFSESTSHSSIARRTRISTPLLPNSGIDEKYNKGCQYSWVIVCPKCKKEQTLDFPDNIVNFFEANSDQIDTEKYFKDIDKVYIGCKYCAAYIYQDTRLYLKTSRWIAKKKHLAPVKASYRVTYMMLPWKTGKEILMKYHAFKFVHQFWNEVMGFAFVDPTAQLTRDLFEDRIDNAYKNVYRTLGNAKNICIGVDWGMTSWLVARANGFEPNRKHSKIIYVEKINNETLRERGYEGLQTDHTKRVAEIFSFFRGKILVNDANGIGVDRNEYLIKKFPTRAWGCFYDTAEIQKQKKKERLLQPMWNVKRRTVTISKLITFKSLVREYEDKQITIPQLNPDIEEFIRHHVNLAFVKSVDDKTGAIFEQVGFTGPDHYAHADVYAKIGFDSIVNIERTGTIGIITKKQDKIGVNINTVVNPDLV